MEWLSITRALQPYLSTSYQQTPFPSGEELRQTTEKERSYLESKKQSGTLDLKIPHNFEATAPAFDPNSSSDRQTILQNRKH
jgi:lariat debranching enzyme